MHLQGNQIRKDSKTLIFFLILYLQHNAAKASKTTKDISTARKYLILSAGAVNVVPCEHGYIYIYIQGRAILL